MIEFTLSILRKNIDGVLSDELALDVFERALELDFGKKHDNFFFAKMAEEYTRIGDDFAAKVCRDAIS